jgi:hypothetical protein
MSARRLLTSKILPFSSRQKSIGRDRRDLLIGRRTHSHDEWGRGAFSSFAGERKIVKITSCLKIQREAR